MIVKKIANPNRRASKATRIGGLVDYIRAPERENSLEKCIYSGERGFILGKENAAAEMLALAQEAVRSKDPINHYMLSWQEGEQPTVVQVEEAITIFLDELGLPDHQAIYGLHADTDNMHIHIAVNRVHPYTLKVIKINKGFDLEVAHKAIARIEHVQGWRREQRGRYQVQENGAVERTQDDPDKIRQPGQRQRDMENRTGEKSAQRIGIEEAAPVIQKAKCWKELHEGLAAIGMRFERDGSGAKIFVGDIGVKASTVDRKASLPKLQQRLGYYQSHQDATRKTPEFTQAVTTQTKKNAKDFANLDQFDQFGPHPETALRRQRLHELRGLDVDGDKDRTVMLLPRDAPDHMEHTKSDFDSRVRHGSGRGSVNTTQQVTRSEPLRKDAPGWTTYNAQRKKYKVEKDAASDQLKEQHTAERAALTARHKADRDGMFTAGDWKGKGDLLNAMRSVVAAEQAADKLQLKERQNAERAALREGHPPHPTYEDWTRRQLGHEQADNWRYKDSEKKPARIYGETRQTQECDYQGEIRQQDIRDYQGRIEGREVRYKRKDGIGGDAFIDKGRRIDVLDEQNPAAVLAALQLASQKFGGKLNLTGGPEFKALCVKLAVQHNLQIINPELQAAVKAEQERVRQVRQHRKQPPAQDVRPSRSAPLSPAQPEPQQQVAAKPVAPEPAPQYAPLQADGAGQVPEGCTLADSNSAFTQYEGKIVGIENGWAIQEQKNGRIAHRLDAFKPEARQKIEQAFEDDAKATLRYENGHAKCWKVSQDRDHGPEM